MSTIEDKTVSLSFFTRLNLKEQKIGQRLIELIYSYGQEFAPELFDDGKRLVPISSTNLDILMKKWTYLNNVLMRREKSFASETAISMGLMASGGFYNVVLWVEESYFELQVRTENFLQISVDLYDLLHPVYGKIHQTQDSIKMATIQDPKYGQTVVPVDLRKGLPNIYWANFFGPEYVNVIGRSKLLSAPCEKIKELSDGGILFLTTTSPLAPSEKMSHAKQKAVRDYLGEHIFYHWGD